MASNLIDLNERMIKAREDSRELEARLQDELEKLKKTCEQLQVQETRKKYNNGH